MGSAKIAQAQGFTASKSEEPHKTNPHSQFRKQSMRCDITTLYAELEKAPEDWSVRLRLIEAAIGSGNEEEAKRLVRESPGQRALPPELQDRIHALMTGHG